MRRGRFGGGRAENRVPPPRPPRPPWAPLPSKCSVPGGTLWTLCVQGGTRDGDNIGNPARASASLADQAKRLRPFDAPGWSPRSVPAGNPPTLPPRALMAPQGQRVRCGLGDTQPGRLLPVAVARCRGLSRCIDPVGGLRPYGGERRRDSFPSFQSPAFFMACAGLVREDRYRRKRHCGIRAPYSASLCYGNARRLAGLRTRHEDAGLLHSVNRPPTLAARVPAPLARDRCACSAGGVAGTHPIATEHPVGPVPFRARPGRPPAALRPRPTATPTPAKPPATRQHTRSTVRCIRTKPFESLAQSKAKTLFFSST